MLDWSTGINRCHWPKQKRILFLMEQRAKISPEQMQLQSKHAQPLLHKTSATPGNDESKGLGRNALDALLALNFHHLVQARTKNIFREWTFREKKLSYLITARKSFMPSQKKKFLFQLWGFSQFSYQTHNKTYR